MATLYALVAELDVSLDELLFNDRRKPERAGGEEAAEGPSGQGSFGPILRGNQRKHIRLASGVIWERLTTRAEPT